MAEHILSTLEIDRFIDAFEPTKLEDIGRKRWFAKSSTFVKLYQVAALEAQLEVPERVKEFVKKYNKTECFIKEVITLFVWKEKVLSELLQIKPLPKHSLPTYIVLYCEVTLVGLLQSLLFHSEMFRDIENCCIDLIDYCVHRLTTANADDVPIVKKLELERSAIDDIKRHNKEINFLVSTHCTSILRYVCENLEYLPLNVAARIYSTHDLPLLITQLLDTEVWCKRTEEGKVFKYTDDGWREWFSKDPPLSKNEVQAWLLIRQLLLNKTCSTVYSFSKYRIEQLSRLARHLHEAVMDQLSPLADLKYWLHANSINSSEGPRVDNVLIVEVTSQYKDQLFAENCKKWNSIALDRSKLLFFANETEMQFIASGFSDCMDNLEMMTENIQTCMNCHAKAIKKCSKCKKAWYCKRECQVEHWPAHKNVCK